MNPGEEQEDRWWIVFGVLAAVIVIAFSIAAQKGML